MNASITNSSNSHSNQYEGFELTNVNISEVLPYSSDMVYKDRFGVYYVIQKMYSSDNKEILPFIREIQVPNYNISLNQENQIASNNSLYQCRQLMKNNGKSDAITLSSRFLYSIPPIHFNKSKSRNSYISKAYKDAENRTNGENDKVFLDSSYLTTPIDPFIDGPFVYTSIGTFVENVRYSSINS